MEDFFLSGAQKIPFNIANCPEHTLSELGYDFEPSFFAQASFLLSFNASSPVSSRRDEVYAAVDSGVGDSLLPVDVDLLLQVRLILVIDELHDGLPAEAAVKRKWAMSEKGKRCRDVKKERRKQHRSRGGREGVRG